MPDGGGFFGWANVAELPRHPNTSGRPYRGKRSKVKAGRKAARRSRR